VVDDGPGFPPGGTDFAFERFYRGDPARSGPGSGLGLAIVRELARAHGGVAIAENLTPHGARVSVVLPVQPPVLVPDAGVVMGPAAVQPTGTSLQ
jgi:two-component system OmpR family sensor kinase